MTKLTWNQESQNRYEFGVDRGVFYSSDGLGFVWNGLTSVRESSVGGSADSHHFDGIKYLDHIQPRNYQASISAYSVPTQFSSAIGDHSLVPGFILTRQVRSVFGLSYRTFIGPGDAYKIHIVYNAIATPTKLSYKTEGNSGSAEIHSWKIDAVPALGHNYRPSAHYIVDSLQVPPGALDAFEDIIYGTDETPARLPNIDELRDIITLWDNSWILAQPTTGLSQLIREGGAGDLYGTTIPGINRALSQTRLQPTPISGLYRLE